jgi:poly-beta-1,6 N-acetyl-D-glucosamine synthase
MRNRAKAFSVALILTSILVAGFLSGLIDETGYSSLFHKCIATWPNLFNIGYISAYYAHLYTVLVPEGTSLFNDVTIALFIFFVTKTTLFVYLSFSHYRKESQRTIGDTEPLVSIIVPCYNEEKTVANCIHGLMIQTYKNFEVILVNDGSKDNTKQVCIDLAAQYNDPQCPEKIRFFDKKNGGKASALRFGLEQSIGKIIVTMDADSIFLKDALKHLVAPFDDQRVGAVGGNVKVANKDNYLGRHQSIEYKTGLAFQRRAFVQLDCMQVIAGAIGAFRRDVLEKVGGYSSDTLVEDMELTVSILKAGYRVEYSGKAIAYTEAPANMKDFLKQRYRWTFGGFQVLRKHWDMLFNRKYGLAGMVGLPYFLVTPWLDVMFTLLFAYSAIRAVVYGGLVEFGIFYSFMMLVQIAMVLYANKLDGEDKKLILSSCFYGLWYNQLLSIVTLFAGIRFLSGAEASWNKLPRLGKNVVPEQE